MRHTALHQWMKNVSWWIFLNMLNFPERPGSIQTYLHVQNKNHAEKLLFQRERIWFHHVNWLQSLPHNSDWWLCKLTAMPDDLPDAKRSNYSQNLSPLHPRMQWLSVFQHQHSCIWLVMPHQTKWTQNITQNGTTKPRNSKHRQKRLPIISNKTC